MRFLVALGHDVEIVVKTRKRGAAELRVAQGPEWRFGGSRGVAASAPGRYFLFG
jgi:hypothetical protein